MTHEEIYEYLTKAENWVILTDDINNNNPNFRYDPVNMGTYNYHASLPNKSTPTLLDKIENIINDDIHDKLDVSTFKKWGNVKGFMYGTTKDERDANGYYYNNYANKDVYENYWKGIFE